MATPSASAERCDVLVVGAGPTGLALALQLAAFGVTCRIVDRSVSRVSESRALAVQPRTLEVLRPLGVADELVRHGNPTVALRLHAGGRVTSVPLFDIGLTDTAYPFLLFLSQARTEAVLEEHLAAAGVAVERRTALVSYADAGDHLRCALRSPDGTASTVRARYLVGCDGAHSTVRELSGVPFVGGRYPQTFLLADLAVDGLEPDTVHAHLTPTGPLLFFPLGEPAPWRLIAMRSATAPPAAEPASLAELQALVDASTGEALRLRDPIWASAFGIPVRQAAAYRRGRVLLAGDAAHVHSPAGGQGMNTGIQDAVNLGWKLALVVRAEAPEPLLDSYDAERRPVGAFVLRFTDRLFTLAASPSPLLRLARAHVAPRLLPWVLRFEPGRAAAFRTVSQLDVRYRSSPAVDAAPGRGVRPGDRLPDARVQRDGEWRWLHEALTAPAYHLLLCGEPDAWAPAAVAALRSRFGAQLVVHHLHRTRGPRDRVRTGALARLVAEGPAQLLVRPDGYVAVRVDGTDLRAAERYLTRWLLVV